MEIGVSSVKRAGTFAGLCAVGGFLYKLFSDYGDRQAGLLELSPVAPHVSKVPSLAAVLHDFQQYRSYDEAAYLNLNGSLERMAHVIHDLQDKANDMQHTVQCVRWIYSFGSTSLDVAVDWVKRSDTSVAADLRLLYEEDLFIVINELIANAVAIGVERGHLVEQTETNRTILEQKRERRKKRRQQQKKSSDHIEVL